MRFQFQHLGSLPRCTQASPYDPVEDGKDKKGDDGGHGDPGPGGVEHDVVGRKPEFCWSDIHPLMVPTSTRREVHAVADGFSLKELGEVEGNGHDDTGNKVEKCATGVAQ